MDISLKYKIVEKIIQSEDDVKLNEISSILGVQESDFWTSLPDEVKKSIDKAKAELDSGQGIAHQQVMADVRKRFL
ncbi:MAG: hypothetical protein EOP47_03070 [Sphingobacteriaceae bacterium]|nr:MAG: hypothetical protein EOP47_03070 [Sphingobacteriaceae bacterium]